MSAFMVSREHLDAMVRLSIRAGNWNLTWYAEDPEECLMSEIRALHREATHAAADSIGRMLALENASSVLYRYPDHDNSEFVPVWTTDDSYTYPSNVHRPSIVQGLKLIDCYEYQSCDHPGWKNSEARRFCEALRSYLIGQLEGYDEAPWEWTADSYKLNRIAR
jgi:hypothetical protein